MPTCDVCGKQVDLPYNCNECGGTYCSSHRLPENHDCPGLKNWGDPDGVFDSGFDDSVEQSTGRDESGGLLDGLRTPDGILGYFKGNMTFVFLALMWITFFAQQVVQFALPPTGSLSYTGSLDGFVLYRSIFQLTAEHPEYVWTWFTSIFAHGGFFHIAFNSIVVYFFGQAVERYIGSRKFAALFLVSGALAGLGQVALTAYTADPGVGFLPGVVGASGAALAIMGVLTVLNPNLTVLLYFLFPVPIWVLTIGFAAISALGVLQSNPATGGIAQGAHLVGLAIGLVYGAYVKDKVSSPRKLQFGGGGGGPGGPGGPRRRGPF